LCSDHAIWHRPCSYHRVLRITIQTTSDVVALKLEGSVKGPWVDELRKTWLTSAKMAGGEPASIDLGAVSFIDARGRDLLLQMQREGVALKGASGFLRQVLEDRNINAEPFLEDRSSK
jgi:anti-anti-sigma regulatory factor